MVEEVTALCLRPVSLRDVCYLGHPPLSVDMKMRLFPCWDCENLPDFLSLVELCFERPSKTVSGCFHPKIGSS